MSNNGKSLVSIAETLVAAAQELARRASIDKVVDVGEAGVTCGVPHTSSQMLHLRRLRTKFLPATLFHEPAWEILLVLHGHDNDAEPMSLKEVSAEVGAPFTTTQRWVDHMVKSNLISRAECGSDRRRIQLSLTPECRKRLDDYFTSARASAATR